MINSLTLTGQIGAKFDLKTTDSLKKYCAFTVCQNRFNKFQNSFVAEWHHAICWGQLAEKLTEKASTGDKICIHGELRTKTFESNGKKSVYEYILIQRFEVLSHKKEKDTEVVTLEENDKIEEPKEVQKNIDFTDSDLPF